MKKKGNILAMVMAGGRGERLFPLTLERSKPSVPFGGKYRIVDFALSNLINSGIYSIYVLVQYKSQSLIEHIRTTWRKEGVLPQHFITVVPPQMRREDIQAWYRGTADSVYQNINLVYDFKPRMVAIFGSDHIYRMNIAEMIDFHLSKRAHVTISTIPVVAKEAHKFGVLNLDSQKRVKSFKEKPRLTGNKAVCASMGNYIFDADILIQTLEEILEKKSAHDFGKDILPYLVAKKMRVYGYDFSDNRIPGLRDYEDQYYWRDVGNIESYWQANMDLLGRHPKLDLFNKSWPIYATDYNTPPGCIVGSQIDNALIADGAHVFESKIKNSLIGRGVKIEEGCEIEDSIIMDFSVIKRHSRIKRAIVDRFNTVEKNSFIGFNRASDSKKYYLDNSGIVVLKRGSRKELYW